MPATTTPFQWSIQPVASAGVTIQSSRLEVELYVRSALSGLHLLAEQGWLDTGAPLSVVPFHVHHGRLDWKQIPGVQLTWAGQICDLGIIDIWLATQETPALRGPFQLLAKFPRSDPPASLVPILIGLEFFLSNQASMYLLPPAQQSTIAMP